MFACICDFCNKDGHEESNCWKLHPELAPKSMQEKSKASVTATAAAAHSTAPSVAATVVANDHVVGKKGKRETKRKLVERPAMSPRTLLTLVIV